MSFDLLAIPFLIVKRTALTMLHTLLDITGRFCSIFLGSIFPVCDFPLREREREREVEVEVEEDERGKRKFFVWVRGREGEKGYIKGKRREGRRQRKEEIIK